MKNTKVWGKVAFWKFRVQGPLNKRKSTKWSKDLTSFTHKSKQNRRGLNDHSINKYSYKKCISYSELQKNSTFKKVIIILRDDLSKIEKWVNVSFWDRCYSEIMPIYFSSWMANDDDKIIIILAFYILAEALQMHSTKCVLVGPWCHSL